MTECPFFLELSLLKLVTTTVNSIVDISGGKEQGIKKNFGSNPYSVLSVPDPYNWLCFSNFPAVFGIRIDLCRIWLRLLTH